MHFDDRLATVLRARSGNRHAACTQFRQLLDILGSETHIIGNTQKDRALARLHDLTQKLPASTLEKIIRTPGTRLRNPELLATLCDGNPKLSAAALSVARLTEEEWADLIPQLPISARGFLRHRRDLPKAAERILADLGVQDLVLPGPVHAANSSSLEPSEQVTVDHIGVSHESDISSLVARIETYRQSSTQADTIRSRPKRMAGCDFATDRAGRINWAGEPATSLLVGFFLPIHEALTEGHDRQLGDLIRRRQPISNIRIDLSGAEAISGPWNVNASPRFDKETGRFIGYAGRLSRLPDKDLLPEDPDTDSKSDKIRQMLHELRTPVNAIQGFAEVIQQQVLGPAPNEYRALSAGIAVDAARLLAGFEEVDRLTKLQSGAMQLTEGACDMREVVTDTVKRLEGPLRPRGAALGLHCKDETYPVALTEEDAQQMIWRILATVAGALAPGEVIELHLSGDNMTLQLAVDLPMAMLDTEDLFAPSTETRTRPLSAGMFGQGFTLRLARAESKAAGGTCNIIDERLILTLPILTADTQINSHSNTEENSPSPIWQ
ncbi:sensor histidine kinase [Altericroceibacterium spongiae]|uniref:histidine kinase n=1 Tax=Altericroceibacterium spongiae TaxID=2320269 RepID=A0A420EKF0_9SPHN|nr:histidine kinase dimerization/phospho-acceptor domain-containing protein [Altericroceibacterium spongiae]RKF21169.1 sensor histidine kinase [Altericroceibacterium spongiae]